MHPTPPPTPSPPLKGGLGRTQESRRLYCLWEAGPCQRLPEVPKSELAERSGRDGWLCIHVRAEKGGPIPKLEARVGRE